MFGNTPEWRKSVVGERQDYTYQTRKTTPNWKVSMPAKPKRRKADGFDCPARSPEVLDVQGAAAVAHRIGGYGFMTSFRETTGADKVGPQVDYRKAAVLRWIENTSTDDTLARAIQGGDMDALTRAMNKGKVRVKGV